MEHEAGATETPFRMALEDLTYGHTLTVFRYLSKLGNFIASIFFSYSYTPEEKGFFPDIWNTSSLLREGPGCSKRGTGTGVVTKNLKPDPQNISTHFWNSTVWPEHIAEATETPS
jgi:hypothetical protein